MANKSDGEERSSAGSKRTEIERSAWPEIAPSIIEYFREAGEAVRFAAGDSVFEVGQENYDFYYLETGSVAIKDASGGHTVATIESGAFVGELGMLMGQKTFLAAVARERVRAIRLAHRRLLELVATVPEVADVVVTAFAARRRLLIEWGEGGLIVVGSEQDPDALSLRGFVERNRIPYRWVDRSNAAEVNELSAKLTLPASGAVVITGDSQVLSQPTPQTLARALGLDLTVNTDLDYDLIIVGAGPAGLAAAVYGSSEGLRVAVIEDTAIGGQAGTSSRIENYLGFPGGISGADLAYRGEVQAVKFGARIAVPRRAVALAPAADGYTVTLDDNAVIRAKAVVLANGVAYRKLPLTRLPEFEGRGIYYAATELEARFCRGTDAVVVGGGNSAGQAAMFLSRYADRTHIMVRSGGLAATMSSYLSVRIERDDRTQLWTDTEITALHGEGRLEAITVRNTRSGRETRIATRAVFVMIGAEPNTAWLRRTIQLDPKGFILTGAGVRVDREVRNFETSLPGVFAVGDIRSGSVKRVASAVGEGSVVVAAVHAFLEARQLVASGPEWISSKR